MGREREEDDEYLIIYYLFIYLFIIIIIIGFIGIFIIYYYTTRYLRDYGIYVILFDRLFNPPGNPYFNYYFSISKIGGQVFAPLWQYNARTFLSLLSKRCDSAFHCSAALLVHNFNLNRIQKIGKAT